MVTRPEKVLRAFAAAFAIFALSPSRIGPQAPPAWGRGAAATRH